MAGVVPLGADDAERERRMRTYVRNLRFACAEASAQGVTMLVEAINPRDMPGYLITTQAQAHGVRTEIGARNLKVQMDFYHAQIVEGNLTETFRRYAAHIGHVQIASVPSRHEPDGEELNFAFLFETIDAAGYDGFVGCEYVPRTTTEAGLGWFAPWRRG